MEKLVIMNVFTNTVDIYVLYYFSKKLLEKSEKNNQTDIYVRHRKKRPVISDNEPNLFNFSSFALADEIKQLDVVNMTPIQAINKLLELQEKVKDM